MRYVRFGGMTCALILCLGLLTSGCTMPTTKVAEQAMQKGLAHTTSVVHVLGDKAKQATVTLYGERAMAAAKAGNVDAAKKAVEDAVTEFDRINAEEKEYLKARWGPLAIGQMYIWFQQGVLDVIAREWETSKTEVAAVEAAQAAAKAATTQETK